MSAGTVRAQLLAYLSTPGITGIETWFADEPWFAAGESWKLSANNGWGAVAWPAITDESEDRLTLPALTGQKEVTYKVSIVVLFQYVIPAGPASADAYSGPLDSVIEAVKARLRADPKAGTGAGLDGVIFQQSQDVGDLHVQRAVPHLAKGGGKVIAWNAIETTVREVITA